MVERETGLSGARRPGRGAAARRGVTTVRVACIAALVSLTPGCGDKSSKPAKPAEPTKPAKATTPPATAKAGKAALPAKDDKAGANKAGSNKAGSNQAGADNAAGNKAQGDKAGGKITKPAVRVLPNIGEAAVTHLLETWVKAQNEGDFETYAALYAEHFYGTKRSGNRARSFKRSAWLRDRKRMFGKRMSVEARDPEVLTTAGTAMVHFEQSWASGRYKDVGPKQLVIVRERGELRIAREEMLGSEVKRGGPKAAVIDSRDFGFVLHDDGPYMVLHTAPDKSWAKGKQLRLLQAGSYASVTSPAVVGKLPEALRSWRGRTVQLYGAKGRVCRGQVVGLHVMSRVRPHGATVSYWRGDEKSRPDGGSIAREAWRLGDTGRVLVGKVMPLQGNDCRGALWSRDAERDAPQLAVPVAVDPPIAARAVAALRKLRSYKTLQKAYVSEVPLPRALEWDRYKAAAPTVSFLANSDGTRRFVSVSVRAGDGCGDFYGELWAIWRIVGEGPKARLQLLTDDAVPGRVFIPRAAADVDGDGRMEFIGSDGLLQPTGPILRESLSVETPSLECPC